MSSTKVFPGVSRPLSAVEKAERLEADIEAGLVLEKPSCPCGWKGNSPAPLGAGCPQCGARLTPALDVEASGKELEIKTEQLAAAAKEIETLKAELEAQSGKKKAKKAAEE